MSIFLQFFGATSLVVAAAWGLIQWLGPKWIEHKFNEKLEEFKRKQEEILEEFKRKQEELLELYRFDIQKMFNRASKVHEKEYEILPELWSRLKRADGAVNLLNMGSFPALNKMTEKEVEWHLTAHEFHDIQKDKIRSATDKEEAFRNIESWRKIGHAESECTELTNYFLLNELFLDKELQAAVDKAKNMLWDKQIKFKWDFDAMQKGQPTGPYQAIVVQPTIDQIKVLMQTRLAVEKA